MREPALLRGAGDAALGKGELGGDVGRRGEEDGARGSIVQIRERLRGGVGEGDAAEVEAEGPDEGGLRRDRDRLRRERQPGWRELELHAGFGGKFAPPFVVVHEEEPARAVGAHGPTERVEVVAPGGAAVG